MDLSRSQDSHAAVWKDAQDAQWKWSAVSCMLGDFLLLTLVIGFLLREQFLHVQGLAAAGSHQGSCKRKGHSAEDKTFSM